MGLKRSKIPCGAVGMVALLLVIEGLVVRHWFELTDPVSLSWRYSIAAARNEARDCDVLCLGDSLVKHGLVPAVFSRVSGERAVNFSAAQGSTILTLSLLSRALDSGAQPKALIVNAKPAVLLGGPECNTRAWQEVLSLRDAFEILRITRNAPLVASILAGRLLPSLRCRLEIQSKVVSALQGETDRIDAINPVLWRNWSANGGANVASAVPAFGGDVTPEVRSQLYTELFYVDPANARAIERMFELAAGRRIPIYWVLFPLAPELQSLRDQSGADRAHDEFVRSKAVRHPGLVTVLDARRCGFPASYFADATHLNKNGALALSCSIAEAIAALEKSPSRPTSTPGWITLGPQRGHAARFDDEIEDLAESGRIIRSNLATASTGARISQVRSYQDVLSRSESRH